MRPIDADRLLKDIEQYHLSDGFFQHWVEVQPTLNLNIVEKKGKWIRTGLGIQCSRCYHKCQTTGIPKRCPYCGAEMEKNDETR